MKKKNKLKKNLTIESQLERYYLREDHTERHEILWHAWCQNKRWISQLLEMSINSFPMYSRHDVTHANAVLHGIEMLLGRERIKELSASDCFMLLHTVYIHDIGMVITYEDRKKIVKDENFIEMIQAMDDENDPVIQEAIQALQKKSYEYNDRESREEQMKLLYSDKLAVYYAILHMIANFQRTEHGNRSRERLEGWTLDSGKLGSGFSMAGIPQRIFLLIARCAGLHTDSNFEHILELPQEDNGYVSDYVHPRFVAVLLQLGDILDMDNDRFHPLTKECMGMLPEMSERHYEKHQSIRKLYIRPDIISIEADCSSQDALRLVRKECDMLKGILKEAGYNWARICPDDFSGALPTVGTVRLYLKGTEIPEELVNTQFRISQRKAFAILEGSNVYKEQYVFLREFVQNATDATKIQYWNDCVRMNAYAHTEEQMRMMSPEDLSRILSPDMFPIKIGLQIAKCRDGKEIVPLSSEGAKEFVKGSDGFWQYGVLVRIKDFGTGIDKGSILNIANVGDSQKRNKNTVKKMPEWLKPTAEFGVGLQSAFLLTSMFRCHTFTRSNEKYEITFSTVKSHYYEGYINVRPIKDGEKGDDNSYGTCFEVFVPIQKKLRHEAYPLAWDGADYFGHDYEKLRPLRHSAELLAQMALYLDSQIRDQLFPVHLEIQKPGYLKIPLNLTEKNRIRNLKYTVNGTEEEHPANTGEMDTAMTVNGGKKFAWEGEGKLWLYSIKDLSEDEKTARGIIVERVSKSVAMLDARKGHLYYWDNGLCTFCVLSMKNFLLRERRQLEEEDHYSRNDGKGVIIYYKGIFLAQLELPGLGNELFEYIDIKGRLERCHINLDRRGFTEEGNEYFFQDIYGPLMEAVQKILKAMNRNQYGEVVNSIERNFNEHENQIQACTSELKHNIKDIDDVFDTHKLFQEESCDIEKIEGLKEMQKTLVREYKESVISIVMLGFFARKAEFSPVLRLGCGNQGEEACCWNEVTEKIGASCRRVLKLLNENSVQAGAGIFGTILFTIACRPKVRLLSDRMESNSSGNVSFPDVISKSNHFMVVSVREDKSAPWLQFLTPIWVEGQDREESLIDLLKRYAVMDNNSREKEKMREKILDAGKKALKEAKGYTFGMRTTESEKGNSLYEEEYLQQYLLKWLLGNIPTAALFMSRDGNTRVNIIHEQRMPYIFMNREAKKLVLTRILESCRSGGIQRYSIAAWQGLEYLSCRDLPYSLFFIKRGYLSRDSYSKVIFPLAGEELRDIRRIVYGEGIEGAYSKLYSLFNSMNILYYMRNVMQSYETLEQAVFEYFPSYAEDEHSSKTLRTIKVDWEMISGMKERIWAGVRNSYRKLVIDSVKNVKGQERQIDTADGLFKYFEGWEKLYLYILLVTISSQYNDGFPRQVISGFESALESLGRAWLYVINGSYMKESLKMPRYKERKLSELKDEHSQFYQTQERILSYICEHGEGKAKKEYLRNCWYKYTEDILTLFEEMEEEQYRELEVLLPEKERIEEAIHQKK